MYFSTHGKDQLPGSAGSAVASFKGRRLMYTMGKVLMGFALVYYCIGLFRHGEQVQQTYDNLKFESRAVLAQDEGVARRALGIHVATSVTTTTTVTQGTTVTLEVTASSSSASSASSSAVYFVSSTSSSAASSATSSSFSPVFPTSPSSPTSTSAFYNATSSAGPACGTGSPQTVTVTVTAVPSTSIETVAPEASFVSFSVTSSLASITVIETRLTTSTIYVTASHSHHVTPKPETETFTATATEGLTATQIVTIHPHPHGGNKTLTGTSTSTADANMGTGSYTIRYPNSTISLAPYGTASSGGLLSTASFTVTVPGGHTGGAPTTTTTSTADPAGTVVTVSGAAKMNGAFTSAAVLALAVGFVLLA